MMVTGTRALNTSKNFELQPGVGLILIENMENQLGNSARGPRHVQKMEQMPLKHIECSIGNENFTIWLPDWSGKSGIF